MNQREKQSIISTLAGAVGLILIVGVAWFYFKEYRLQTYEDPKGRFSISYPRDWSAVRNVNGAEVIISSPIEGDFDLVKENLNVVIQDLSADPLNLEKYSVIAVKQMQMVFKDNIKIEEAVEDSLSGLPAFRFVFTGKGNPSDVKYYMVWTIKGTKAYQVTFLSPVSQFERYTDKV